MLTYVIVVDSHFFRNEKRIQSYFIFVSPISLYL